MENGRPTVFNESTLQKLEIAFSNDATDEQACFLANIATSSLYNYQKEHPEFLERKRALKQMVTYQAKVNLKECIYSQEKDLEKEKLETSKWLLPKREKEHYSERSELTGAGGKDLVVNVIKYGGDNNTTPIQT